MFEVYLLGVKVSFFSTLGVLLFCHYLIAPDYKKIKTWLSFLAILILNTLLSWISVFCYSAVIIVMLLDE
jgi:hypothetical protein